MIFKIELDEIKANHKKEIEELEKELKSINSQLEEVNRIKIDSLNEKIRTLESSEEKLESKLATQIDLESEIISKIRTEFQQKHEDNMKLVEDRIESIVKERVNTTVGNIKNENDGLIKRNEDLKDRMKFYKGKFEGGKVEMCASEIKGLLLSANPNGGEIYNRLKEGND